MFWPRRRAILLIHGYNVTEDEALDSLGQFRDALTYYAPALLQNTFVCTWAGNWDIPLLRPTAYPFILSKAKESADTLLEYLTDWYASPSAPAELVIIAHSLGCRLLLETLLKLRNAGKPPSMARLIVVLMAAAVPIDYFLPQREFLPLVGFVDVMVILHSHADTVLSTWFGPGQTAAHDGRFPEAVGLRGHPLGTPWTREHAMLEYDHGDYWRELETAEIVCEVLGLPISPSSRALPLRQRKALAMRDIPTLPFLPML